jgi:hypothetical protein
LMTQGHSYSEKGIRQNRHWVMWQCKATQVHEHIVSPPGHITSQ